MKRIEAAVVGLLLTAGCAAVPQSAPRSAEMWLTTADQTQKLAPQPILAPVGPATGHEVVAIDTASRFQRMQGFGAAMTDASAELLSRLPEDKRRAVMAELFGRANGGLGLSFTRLTVGASDFSRTHYSYDDTPENVPDPHLEHFSIAPARQYVLPRIREALAINPDLKVMISPWSAPAWMKTTHSLIQGQLSAQYYPAFANYLARTVQVFGAEGVPVSMLTIQNEPDFEPDSYPGMRVNSPDRAKIIGGFVGPVFRARGLKLRSSITIITGTIRRCRGPCSPIRSPGGTYPGWPGIATKATSQPNRRFMTPFRTKTLGSPNAQAANGRQNLPKCSAG